MECKCYVFSQSRNETTNNKPKKKKKEKGREGVKQKTLPFSSVILWESELKSKM